MLELAFIILCILGLCGVVGVKVICIVGLVYAAVKILREVLIIKAEKRRSAFEGSLGISPQPGLKKYIDSVIK